MKFPFQHVPLPRYLLLAHQKVQNLRLSAILGLAKLVESRDQETGLHLERIQEYVKLLASELARNPKYTDIISEDYIKDLGMSSILHDIGKMGMPDSILLKPGPLAPDEFAFMKEHTRLGEEILQNVESMVNGQELLSLGKDIALSHHERWDGKGYPFGLQGMQIPLAARMVSVVDVYDALTSRRCYKAAYTHNQAVRSIVDEKGGHFEPDIVDAFVANEQSFDYLRQKMKYQHKGPVPELSRSIPIKKQTAGIRPAASG
jgi:response regulator RpfG family c-di-GMP phosphodiesterase